MLLRIGELARRAGVTVRTLRHYEALGVLRPTSRTPGGDRVYGQADAMRLHAVLALKQFGCSLAVIRRLLDTDGASLPDILDRQAAALAEQAERATRLGEKLTRLRARLLRDEDTAMADWLETLALMHVSSRHFTPDELEALRRGRDRAVAEAEAWAAVVAAVDRAVASGLDPGSEAGLAVAERAAAVGRRMAGGDAALAGKLRELVRREAGARQAAGLTGPMLEWLEQALEAARRLGQARDLEPGEEPSRTAMAMAMLRAAHQILDTPPVFDDPLALRLIGPEREAALRADPGRFDAGVLRGVRVSGALRSRVTADAFAEARASGVGQYVVLGAGLDTAPWREADGWTRFFEVDRPATQAFLRELLDAAGLAIGDDVIFVPLDFETDRLGDALALAGLDRNAPVFCSGLGVTMYLERATVRSVLAWVASLPAGSRIVFDYAVDPALLSDRERQGREAVIARTTARGEPWKSHFAPAELAAMLGGLGFSRVDDPEPRVLSERYLAGRADGLRKSGVTRILTATV